MSPGNPQVKTVEILKQKPEVLPDTLTDVPKFDFELLPEVLRTVI